MTKNESKALVKHVPRVVQREADRQMALMRAHEAVSKDVIESGLEVQNHAGEKMVSAAHFGHMMLQGASQTLNGTYAALEEDYHRQLVAYREFVFQCTARYMARCLRQIDNMPEVPEKGAIARLGDGIASVRDELDRARES